MRGRDLVILIVAIAILAILAIGAIAVFAGGMMGGYGWPGMMGYRWFGFTPVWMVLMLVFWLLVIGGIVALVWWFVRPGRSTIVEGDRSTQRGLEVLHERYARGEITKEQYDQMKRDILGS